MIDLRSDTLTKPTPEMLQAMAHADVGDDVYGEDPTINELERRTADLLGHEAGLFCATGSMSNMLGIYTLVAPGQEIVCDVRAHIARAEMGAHAALHGVTMRTWFSEDGLADPVQIEKIITPDAGPNLVSTAAVEVENTHNFGGGTIQPFPTLQALSALCHDAGVSMHLDGARLWNAHVATGIPLADYGTLFDTVSVCYSKGLGAPVGSVLVSSAERIARARIERKRLGGGWREAGVLAAAALYALDHHVDRLAEDHEAAKAFAGKVAQAAPQALDAASVQTNIVVMDSGDALASDVLAEAKNAGVLVSSVGRHGIRAVAHLGVTKAESEQAGEILGAILAR